MNTLRMIILPQQHKSNYNRVHILLDILYIPVIYQGVSWAWHIKLMVLHENEAQ